jgi:protoheme IX farnesyltransferase
VSAVISVELIPARSSVAPPQRSAADGLRTALILAKPRVVGLVLFTAVVACVAAAGGRPAWESLVLLVVSGCLSAGGAAALNHYLDRDIDARMARTRNRPLVNGHDQHAAAALAGGLAAIALGTALALPLNPMLAAFELAGAVIYVAVYTLWLKRRTALNIVIGGAAGSAAVLGGWAAAEPDLGLAAWLLAGVVFTWTPAHFWSLALARRPDYAAVGVPMLPVVMGPVGTARWVVAHAAATAGLCVWFGLVAGLGPLFFGVALVAGLAFLRAGLRLLRTPDAAAGWRTFKLSGAYLGLVFLGVLADVLVAAWQWP